MRRFRPRDEGPVAKPPRFCCPGGSASGGPCSSHSCNIVELIHLPMCFAFSWSCVCRCCRCRWVRLVSVCLALMSCSAVDGWSAPRPASERASSAPPRTTDGDWWTESFVSPPPRSAPFQLILIRSDSPRSVPLSFVPPRPQRPVRRRVRQAPVAGGRHAQGRPQGPSAASPQGQEVSGWERL